jgi:hypothetical protein
MGRPTFPSPTPEPFPVDFLANPPGGIHFSGGLRQHRGRDYYGDEPNVGKGRIWICELDDIDVAVDMGWLRFEGVGLLRCKHVHDHVATLYGDNGQPFELDLDPVVSNMR